MVGSLPHSNFQELVNMGSCAPGQEATVDFLAGNAALTSPLHVQPDCRVLRDALNDTM